MSEINDIMYRQIGDIVMLNDSITAKSDTLTVQEKEKLKKGRESLGVYIISKYDNKIYYGLWGFLDVRLGIIYLGAQGKNGGTYRHLKGSWFR